MKKCLNEFGNYDNQECLYFPDHMYESNGGYYTEKDGCTIDPCLVEEIKYLWGNMITTLNCCCGHGKIMPSIIVMEKDIDKMIKLGYTQKVDNIFIAKSKHMY